LKIKFSNNWDSVRKAFLGLDTDYDGYITVEDLLRNFGSSSNFGNGGGGNTQSGEPETISGFNFNDLKKLLIEKDSTRQGRLGYADFSKWVGNSIHQSEGFYFRHDSIKNPHYEQAVAKRSKQTLVRGKNASDQAIAVMDTQALE